MVTYSFQRQFVKPILARTKIQTIRSNRARHARPGEELQLYTGMRTKHCKLICRAICTQVDVITMFLPQWNNVVKINGQFLPEKELEALAIKDGFESWQKMRKFWFDWHGRDDSQHHRLVEFEGVIISWDPMSITAATDLPNP